MLSPLGGHRDSMAERAQEFEQQRCRFGPSSISERLRDTVPSLTEEVSTLREQTRDRARI
jgi:hypothetical protein